jgi:hypothetical protein
VARKETTRLEKVKQQMMAQSKYVVFTEETKVTKYYGVERIITECHVRGLVLVTLHIASDIRRELKCVV